MTELSYRVSKETSDARCAEITRKLRAAYAAYASATPFPNSRHTPPLLIEALKSANPFTEHGKVRGVLWIPDGRPVDPWWQDAIRAVMHALREEFPGRGVVVLLDSQGSALKLKPAGADSAAA